jgi:hypothetical protein
MAAAGIRPETGPEPLATGALLEQQFAPGVEQEYGKSAM